MRIYQDGRGFPTLDHTQRHVRCAAALRQKKILGLSDLIWRMLSWVVGIIGCLCVVVALLWNLLPWLYRYQRLCRCVRGLPGWPTHWLLGNVHQFAPTEEVQLKWSRYINSTRHRMTRAWLGPFHVSVAIHHPELLHEVIKQPKHTKTYDILRPWLGDGLLLSEGAKWQRNRRLLTTCFHFEVLKSYVTVYNNCLEAFLDKWTLAAKRNEPVEVFDTVSLLSLDIILQCAFSFKSNCQHVGTKHPYIRAVYDLVELIAERFFNPLLYLDFIYSFTPQGRRSKEACKLVHDHSEKIICERRRALESNGERSPRNGRHLDFLDTLLLAVDSSGKGLTDGEIRDEADTFMFEGHDTTTSGIAWTLYCLAQHPEHQDKIREEVQEVLAGREWLQYEDLQHLKYTQMCIKEAMRLYPPVFLIFRVAKEDFCLDGVTIPEGMILTMDILTMQRRPDLWKDPLVYDPLRFDPSDSSGEFVSRDPLSYMPFSAGYRNCIGQNFALNEEKVVVASIVSRFVLSLEEGHKVEMAPQVVLRTTNDIKIRLETMLS